MLHSSPFFASLIGDTGPWQFHLIACYTILGLYIARLYLRKSNNRRLPLPPGPPRLPLLGNLFNIPKPVTGQSHYALSQIYGDIVHFDVLGQHMIVVNSMEAAFELLDKQSAKYSGRPCSTMSELVGMAHWNIGLLDNGELWRRQRKEFHRFMNVSAVSQYNSIHEAGTRDLLRKLLDDPRAFSEHTKFIVAATILQVAYGIRVETTDDEYLALADEGADIIVQSSIQPRASLVEALPFLRHISSWIPGAGFRKQAEIWRETLARALNQPYEATVKKMREGNDQTSMVAAMIIRVSEDGTPPEEYSGVAKGVAAATYLGGVDTTVSVIRIFFLLMANNSKVQKRAQNELDTVVGPDRLPTFSDRESLPYIEAVIKECYRWNPIVPLALPRTALEDDEYKGYRIPAGSIVWGNSWALSHDRREYPEPDQFIPGRFLKDGKPNADVRDPRTFVFGYGRRVCPGRHFADTSIFVTIASILHTFNIEPPLDERGKPTVTNVKMTTGLISVPESFDCRITVRSPVAENLILEGSVEGRPGGC